MKLSAAIPGVIFQCLIDPFVALFVAKQVSLESFAKCGDVANSID